MRARTVLSCIGAPTLVLAASLLIPVTPPRALAATIDHASITSIRLNTELPGTRMAPTNRGLTAIAAGRAIHIVLYVHVTGLTQTVSTHIELAITHNGRQLFLSRGNYPITRSSIGGQSQGWRWFWSTVGPCSPTVAATGRPECLPRTPGRYTVTGSIQTGGDQRGEGFYLTVH